MEKVKLNRHFISDIFFYQEGPGVRKWQFKDSGVKLINVGNINNGKIDLSSTKINISKEEAYGKYSHFLIDEGDLLIACSGIVVENFHNKIAFIKKEHLPLCLNTSTMRFKELPEKKGTLNFLKYFLQTNDFKSQLRKLITGSAQLNFGPSHIRKIEIPLPPLATQQKIATILDQADAIIQNNRAIVQKYDALTQSLFLDMFGDPVKNEKGWEKTVIDKVCSKVTDGEHGTVKRVEEGKLYLMARNVRENYIDLNEVSYIEQVDHDKIYKRCNVEKGDILLVCVGATIGRICIVPEMESFSLARSVALLKPNYKMINNLYLYHYLNTNFMQGIIKTSGNSSAQAGLYTGKIKELPVLIPSIFLQNQFAERVAVIEEQKRQAQLELAKSEELFASLLQRAFKGEL